MESPNSMERDGSVAVDLPAVSDPRVRDALDRMADAGLRELAERAVESMCWDVVPIDAVSQLDLQEFLWRTLPTRWLVSDREIDLVPEALAQLFDKIGRYRHAEHCRSETTRRMIEAWQRAGDRGAWTLYGRELERSGVLPVDTGHWRWSGGMGLAEARLHDECAVVLETALDEGRFVPGAGQWRAAQRRIIDAWIDTPLADDPSSRTPRAIIEGERLDRWLAEHSFGAARSIPHGVRQQLGELFEAGDRSAGADHSDRDGSVGGAARIVVAAAAAPGGVRLTQAGRLGRAFVGEMFDELGWRKEWMRSIRGEDDAPALGTIRETLVGLRLVRRTGGKLVATRHGRELVRTPFELASAVLQGICDRAGIDGVSMQVTLALLATRGDCDVEDLGLQFASSLHGGGWRDANEPWDAPPDPRMASWWMWPSLHLLDALVVMEFDAGRMARSTAYLTRSGRAIAIDVLRACALGPAPDPRST